MLLRTIPPLMVCKQTTAGQRDVGPVTASAIIATAGDASQFKNGREFAAWLGLTPLNRSSGGKEKLGRITTLSAQSRLPAGIPDAAVAARIADGMDGSCFNRRRNAP